MQRKSERANNHLMRADLSSMRILIVDRHPAARDMLRMMLGTLGIIQVAGAGSAAEVLRHVRSSRFDVIFSDFLLEDGRDGQQLLEELRGQSLIPRSTAFFVITSERATHNVVAVAELTPDDYLIKPFTAEELMGRLGRALFRKSVFANIFKLLESDSLERALAACGELLESNDDFVLDTLRLKGEILTRLGRYADAEGMYKEVLAMRPLPWAKYGLARVLHLQRNFGGAEVLSREILREHPHFMAAHDLLAHVLEDSGDPLQAQIALADAVKLSPNNTFRQRRVGDLASRNGDLETAEQAYQAALRRARGSSLLKVDDYTNLSRVMLDQGKVAQARTIALDLRRDRRGDPLGEMAALITESQCAHKEGDAERASLALTDAIAVEKALSLGDQAVPERVSVDLADACFAAGRSEEAQEILRRAAFENPENSGLAAQILRVFERAGLAEDGERLLQEVTHEMRGAEAALAQSAQGSDTRGHLERLCETAERLPNLSFLLNAVNGIFAALDRDGWQNELAERGLLFLSRAQRKDAKHPGVLNAADRAQQTARKYGIALKSVGQGTEVREPAAADAANPESQSRRP